MSDIRWPKRPETFADALDYYLWLVGYRDLVPEDVLRAISEANPHGMTWGNEDRKAMHDLMLAFAVKERAA